MNTPQEIYFILRDKTLTSKNKIFCIYTVIEADIKENYKILESDRAYQQIMSEILYLYEKNENSKTGVNAFWINTRVKLLTKNLSKLGYIVLRTACEFGIDFIENVQNIPLTGNSIPPPRKGRINGWQRKTRERFEKYCCLKSQSQKTKRQIEEIELPLCTE